MARASNPRLSWVEMSQGLIVDIETPEGFVDGTILSINREEVIVLGSTGREVVLREDFLYANRRGYSPQIPERKSKGLSRSLLYGFTSSRL